MCQWKSHNKQIGCCTAAALGHWRGTPLGKSEEALHAGHRGNVCTGTVQPPDLTASLSQIGALYRWSVLGLHGTREDATSRLLRQTVTTIDIFWSNSQN